MQYLDAVDRRGAIVSIMWPIFVELVLQMLVGNADQMMVSRYSQNAVGAIGNANQIINLLILLFSVVSMASTILISQYIGSGNREKVEQLYTLALFINLLFSLIISLILLLGSRQIFLWMRVPQEMMEDTCRYSEIIGSGMFLQALYLTFTSFFRSNAMMKVTMMGSVVINLVNIGGNAVLINGFGAIPALGVMGAAISSNLSRLVGLLVIIFLFYRLIGAKITLKHLHPFPFTQFRRMMRVGLPAGGESVSYSLSQVAIQSMCNLFPVYVINTRVFSNTFAMVAYIFASAIGQATQIIIGYLMGARRIGKIERQVMLTVYLAVAVSFSISVLLFLFSDPLFGLFTEDTQVFSLGKKVLAVEIVLEIGRAVNIILVGALQATGDVHFPIAVSVIFVWTAAVGVGYLLGISADGGLLGIWAAMALDECTRAVVLFIRWKRGKWKTKNLLA